MRINFITNLQIKEIHTNFGQSVLFMTYCVADRNSWKLYFIQDFIKQKRCLSKDSLVEGKQCHRATTSENIELNYLIAKLLKFDGQENGPNFLVEKSLEQVFICESF